MADRRALQKQCAELKLLGRLPKGFKCTVSTELLRAAIERSGPGRSNPTDTLSLPGDLLNIVSTYTTTAVTFELITVSATNWREAYNNVLWKRKLQYEARGLLVHPAVIEANAGESKNV